MSRTNTENRKKLRYPHTVGKRSFAIIREKKQKETTDALSSKDIFVATRTRKPNRVYKESYEDTIHKIAEMEIIQTGESEDDRQVVDAFAAVMGPEHPGRVRLYGRGVTNTILKDKVGDPGSSTDELMKQKMDEIEERMTQKLLEKLEEQRDTMQQEIAINIIARLQCLNPGLQLDPDMLAFCARARSLSSGETSSSQGGENEERKDESMEDLS